MAQDPETPKKGLSRRNFLRGTSLATAGLATAQAGLLANVGAELPPPVVSSAEGSITLQVNGRTHRLLARPDETLADALREHLDLTGTKVVCGRGACSACTVMLDDKPVCSCLTLAVEAQDKAITTIEGLADGDQLTPIQEAFIEEDASMCGYCTPGMIMSCTALLDRNPNPTLQDAKEAVRGNLCRCGTYPHVFKAVLRAAKQ